MQKVPHGGLQSGEAEVVVRVLEQRAWKIKSSRIPVLGEPVNFRTGRIGQAQKLSCFVEAFAGSVIKRAAEHRELQQVANMHKDRMPATDNLRNVRLESCKIGRRRISCHPGGVQMSFQMIYSHKGLIAREGDCLRSFQADHQRVGKAGALRCGNRIDLADIDICCFKRFAHDRLEITKMLARGEFRHDTAIFRVQLDLRGDDVRYDSAILHHSRAGFIAGGFNGQNLHLQNRAA